MKNGLIIDADGSQAWYLDYQFHRDENDLPAVIGANGFQTWCRHGQFHRETGPAFICAHGSQWWYRHGQLHRENGPAIINEDGSQAWYINNNQIDVEKWIKDNDITTSWESWDETTWSLFRLEFL